MPYKTMFLFETWSIVYKCLLRKITNSGITQQLHKQLRLFMFEQRFYMQTPKKNNEKKNIFKVLKPM